MTVSLASPYRSALLIRFPQATLPQPVVDYLVNQCYLTGRYHSLFRHGPASAPEGYEVREGSPDRCDRSVLGGAYDALEEYFFDVAWVAHAHPPHKSPLPSDEDLEAVSARARLNPRNRARHVLFGFRNDEPVSVEVQILWDSIFRGAAVLHRASPSIAVEADLRIQEWLAPTFWGPSVVPAAHSKTGSRP